METGNMLTKSKTVHKALKHKTCSLNRYNLICNNHSTISITNSTTTLKHQQYGGGGQPEREGVVTQCEPKNPQNKTKIDHRL